LTFYANDQQVARWVHSEAAKPYAKGKGASHMVVDLVSADYGWLQSPDGEEEAQVLFKVGKNREGYFMAENILNQAARQLIFSKNSIQMRITFGSMIMQQLTRNEQMGHYQHITCH